MPDPSNQEFKQFTNKNYLSNAKRKQTHTPK